MKPSTALLYYYESNCSRCMNIPKSEIVNLPPDEVAMAAALALDDRIVQALVELIFSQIPEDLPPS